MSSKLREKCPNTDLFLRPYFPVFRLNTEVYSVNLHIHSNIGKYGPEITLHWDTFHSKAVLCTDRVMDLQVSFH